MTDPAPPPFGVAYEHYMAEKTDSPLAFHHFAAPVICAAALGNRVWVETSWGRVYPSMWLAFVGPSTVRKSTAVNLACDLLSEAIEGIELPDDFSREAFYDRLAQQPAGILRWREMGSVLEVFNLDYMRGVSATLTDFWDSPRKVVRELKAGGNLQRRRVVIQRPAVTILAAGKVSWFVENVKRRDIQGGFISRWLFVYGEEPGRERDIIGEKPREDHIVRDSLLEHLRALSALEGPVDTSRAQSYLNARVKELTERYTSQGLDFDSADFTGRAATQILKLAMGIQASYGPDEALRLTVRGVDLAINMFQTALRHDLHLIDDIQGASYVQNMMQKMDTIIDANDGVISQRDLCRAMGLTSDRLGVLLTTKIEMGDWVKKSTESTTKGGRPPAVYRRVLPWST
jgi:hypothetical protein